MSYYAVAKGRNPGIYSTWDECKEQVHKFSGPIYKKFGSKSKAESFIKANSDSSLKRLRCISDTDSDNDIEIVKQKQFKHDKPQNKDSFSVDLNGYVEVYTDGACTRNGRGNAKAGIGVWFSEKNAYNVSQPVIGRATNNMAEIQAVTIAAKQAQKAGIKKLKINTDSQFLISCITQWMPKWKRCGWKTSTGNPVINKTELVEMEEALAPLKVSWNHVRGHKGIHGNEMADQLARNGAERY